MIEFQRLNLENYKSFKEAEFPLANQGLTLVEGYNKTNDRYQSNGTGKSSLLEGLTYALYGRTASKLRADEVINRQAGKNTKAEIEFTQHGTPYKVARYRKHDEHKNKVKLYRDGEDITAKSTRDTDKLIEDIVGISYDVWANSIFYGQGEAEMFAEATDKGKKEILENITSISIYAKAQEIAKERVKSQQLEEDRVNRDIEDSEREIEHIKDSVSREQEQYQQVQNLIDARKRELEEAKAERKKFPQDQYRALQKKFDELDSYTLPPFNPDERVLREAENNRGELQEKANQFNTMMSNMEGQLTVKQQQQAQLNTAESCPTCGQAIDASNAKQHYDELGQEISQLQETIRGYREQYEQVFVPAIEEADKAIKEAQIAIESERQEHSTMVTEYESEHREWEQQLQVYATNKSQLESNVENAKKAYEEVKGIPKPSSREDEIEALKERIGQYKEDLNNIFLSKNNYEKAVKAFSNKGIRSMVLDLVTPTLTNSANHYLTELTDSYIQVEFTTQVENQDGSLTDNFDVNVVNGGAETTYQSLSQGEKTRVDVAISLALQDLVYSNNQLSANIALYDEVFDGLDSVGVTSVINILEEKAKEIGSVFVITHSDTMKPLFENVVSIVKETDGISYIEKET